MAAETNRVRSTNIIAQNKLKKPATNAHNRSYLLSEKYANALKKEEEEEEEEEEEGQEEEETKEVKFTAAEEKSVAASTEEDPYTHYEDYDEEFSTAMSAPSTPPRTPPREPVFAKSLSPSLFQKMSLRSDESDDVTAAGDTTDDKTQPPFVDSEASIYEKPAFESGTREYPYFEGMWIDRPDRNRMFEAQFVAGMKRLGWKRPAFHIHTMIDSLDIDLWSASIPAPYEFPKYKDRCILVKRPALSFTQKHPELYHVGLKCQDTKEAHQGYIIESRNVGRYNDFIYHLLVFPANVVLHNTHFAGEATETVKTHVNPVNVDQNHAENFFKKKLRYIWIYWEIALKDGGIKLQPDSVDTVNKSNLFS